MIRKHSVVIAFALLCTASSFSVAQARQGGPPAPPADLAQRIRAGQDQAFREQYGFTDKQIAQYRKKDAAIKAAYEKKTEALRSQVAKSPPPKKRELYTQIRALDKQMDVERNRALLSVATPAQQPRIKAQFTKQGIPF
jgi:Spy/CpxP family protein refolding chaperone